jgi:hypothetical protein
MSKMLSISLRKKTVVVFFMVISITAISIPRANAQEAPETKKITATIDLGGGFLVGQSNLSPFGVDYRKNYSSGMNANVKLAYSFTKSESIGLKYNILVASGNYDIKGDASVADDLTLHYLAPQYIYTHTIGKKLLLNYSIGAGYLMYRGKSLLGAQELKNRVNMWAANIDLALLYPVSKRVNMGVNAGIMTAFNGSKLSRTTNGVKEMIKLDDWNKIKINRVDLCFVFQVSW